MAIRMEEHSVACFVRAAMSSPNDVMVVPASEFGDFLLADRTDALLFIPKVEELTALPEIVCHVNA